MKEHHHHHHNIKSDENLGPMAMVCRVVMTMVIKSVHIAILQGHATVIATMSTVTRTQCRIMSRVLTKIVIKIIIIIPKSSQVIASQATTMVIDSIHGDVDVHSHLQTMRMTMTT